MTAATLQTTGQPRPAGRPMNTTTVTFAGRTLSLAEWLGLMGVWCYCSKRRPNVIGVMTAATSFDVLVDKAVKRGFPDRRLLKAAMRTGKVGPTALQRCETVIAMLEPGDVLREVASASRMLELMAKYPPARTRGAA